MTGPWPPGAQPDPSGIPAGPPPGIPAGPPPGLPVGNQVGYPFPAQSGGGAAPAVAADSRAYGIVGIALAVAGAAAVVISFLSFDWINDRADQYKATFANLHTISRGGGAFVPLIPRYYFTWLGWTAIGVTLLIALLANAPTGVAAMLRPLGMFAGLVGAVITFFAVQRLGFSYGDTFTRTDTGFYLAMAGFVLAGIGAATGPRATAS